MSPPFIYTRILVHIHERAYQTCIYTSVSPLSFTLLDFFLSFLLLPTKGKKLRHFIKSLHADAKFKI